MKKNFKATLALMLAALFTLMPFVGLTKANAQNLLHESVYSLSGRLVPGHEYVIVANDDNMESFYAMSAMAYSSSVTAASVNVIDSGADLLIRENLDSALVWTAVELGDDVYLRNNLTGRYLGSLFGPYTWSSIYAADSIAFSRAGISMRYSAYSSSYLHFDAENGSFYLSNQQSPWNVNFYEKQDPAVFAMPFEG